jgi:hypothetical protein
MQRCLSEALCRCPLYCTRLRLSIVTDVGCGALAEWVRAKVAAAIAPWLRGESDSLADRSRRGRSKAGAALLRGQPRRRSGVSACRFRLRWERLLPWPGRPRRRRSKAGQAALRPCGPANDGFGCCTTLSGGTGHATSPRQGHVDRGSHCPAGAPWIGGGEVGRHPVLWLGMRHGDQPPTGFPVVRLKVKGPEKVDALKARRCQQPLLVIAQ